MKTYIATFEDGKKIEVADAEMQSEAVDLAEYIYPYSPIVDIQNKDEQ